MKGSALLTDGAISQLSFVSLVLSQTASGALRLFNSTMAER